MTMYFSNFNGICAVKHKNNQIVAGLLFFHIIFGFAGILPLGSSLSASYAILENPISLIFFSFSLLKLFFISVSVFFIFFFADGPNAFLADT